ncbi:hypothetical protein Hanom_Chr15g01367601 [Helianthus anomalus]
MSIGDLPFSDTFPEPASSAKQPSINQTPGSGRARRDAAARAMQGWHSQRLLNNGGVGDPIIKDRTPSTSVRRDKRDIGLLKRKKPSPVERAVKLARMKALKPQLDSAVVDVGLPADWVKINVQRTPFDLGKITKMLVDQTCFQICHVSASLERRIMRGMRPSSTGCVLRVKPNKKWTRGHGMRPSSTECVHGIRPSSF